MVVAVDKAMTEMVLAQEVEIVMPGPPETVMVAPVVAEEAGRFGVTVTKGVAQ